MNKHVFIPVVAALVSFASVAHAEVDQSNPQTLVKSAIDQVFSDVRAQGVKPGQIGRVTAIVNKDVLPYADMQRTTQLAMGRNWRAATPAQQQQIVQQFEQLLIRTYAGAVAQIRPDQQITYLPFRADPSDTDVVVRTTTVNNGQPFQIDYRLYKSPQGWRVYDMNVLGAWLIQTYQQQFNEKVQQSGIDGLIKFLTERNAQLTAGQS